MSGTERVTSDVGAARRYRANPNLRLVPDTESSVSAYGREVNSRFGVLVDAHSGVARHEVDAEAALVFLTLLSPGQLPVGAAGLATGGQEALRRLLLAGILQLETHSGFVEGIDAVDALGWRVDETGFDRLSGQALAVIAALPTANVTTLAHRLYTYGRLPATRRLRDLYPNDEAVVEGLRLRRLAKWTMVDPENGWFSAIPNSPLPGSPLHKMYVSVHVDDLADALHETARCASGRAVQFKVGRDLPGLLRPDKLVAYFASHESLMETATNLRGALAGARAHGVPFSCRVTPDYMLSTGSDPLDGGDSWRSWLCRRAAEAIVTARQLRTTVHDQLRHASYELATEGVDISTFSPTSTWFATTGAPT